MKSRNSLLKKPVESKFQTLKEEFKNPTTDDTERVKYSTYDINAHIKREIKTS